jgi:hypothetical protein
MSENLVKLWTTQFTTLLELKLQQKGSKLRGRVREGSHVGKLASPINQVSAVQSRAPAGRFAPMARVDADFTRRWVFPTDRELPQLVDSFDELRTIVDPKSMYVENAANAFGRDHDDAIIGAAFGTAQVGTDNASLSSETWASISSNFTVAENFKAASETGLTVAKMIEAKRILEHYHNDLETDDLTIVIGSKQHSDLLNQVQVVSTEFNDRPVLVEGRVTRFLGYNVVVSERLQFRSDDADARQVIVFVKSGLYLGVWQDTYNRISQRNDLSSEPWQVYSKHTFGATRTQPGKVIEIDCLDSTGADITP